MTASLLTRTFAALLIALAPLAGAAQNTPLRIEITEGVIEPLPFAIPEFVAENTGAARLAGDIARVVADDLNGSGLFREIPAQAHVGRITSFTSPIQFVDWKAVNAQALVTGAVGAAADGRITVKFRLFDVFAQAQMGEGLQFTASAASWRRMAHKVADAVYARLTGESGYFDTRIAFVAEEGPKNARTKRIAIMDYDGADVRFLTDDRAIVLAPRFSPEGSQILYTSWETGQPRVFTLDVARTARRALDEQPGMTFAPRYSPDGKFAVMSAESRGNTDLYRVNLATGARTRLTSDASIETAPSFSPDGRFIAFESDRSGGQQLYIMPATGGEARRISFGQGRYGTPVWSPRGDLIAFTKKNGPRFHIGVLRTDGSEERLLTSSFLDEGPSWAPNGRVIAFFRETSGASGAPGIYTIDITGRNLRRVATPGFASDPAWSPLLQ